MVFTLSGTPLSSKGTPLPLAQLVIQPLPGSGGSISSVGVRTDAAGYFTVELPTAPNLQYVIRSAGSNQIFPLRFPAPVDGSALDFEDLAPLLVPSPIEDYSRGASAFEVAVANGFVGTEEEWLESHSGTSVSPNILNLAAGQDGYFWNDGGSTPLALAGYWASEKMPVTPGEQYTVQAIRSVQFFGADGARIPGTYYVNDSTFATKTVTVPDGRYFMAVSTTTDRKNIAQVEPGTTATPYRPYGHKITVGTKLTELETTTASLDERVADLEGAPSGATIAGALTLHKVGDVLLLRHAFDTTRDLVTPLSLDGSSFTPGEPRVRMTNTAMASVSTIPADTPASALESGSNIPGSVAIHGTADDNAPISSGGSYVGANHGWMDVKLTATAHGKTNADRGSTWSDGTRTYTLLAVIDANNVLLGLPYTVDGNGAVNLVVMLPQATLTHVVGATNTTSMPITGGRVFDQLRPSSHSRTVTATLDGAPLRDGTTTGRVLLVTETYTIASYKGIIDRAQANIGTDPIANLTAVAHHARVTTTWRWEGRDCIVGQTVTAVEPLNFFMMVTQAYGLTVPSGTLRQFFPGATGTLGGLDLTTEAVLSTQTDNLLVPVANQADPADPIARAYQWRYTSGGARDYGIALGLLPVMDGKPATRKANGTDGTSWLLANATKKNYPRLTGPTKVLPAGQSLSGVAFRRYLSPQDGPALVVSDGSRSWVMIDSANAASSGSVAPAPSVQGRALDVVGSTNVTASDYVTPAGVAYSHPAPGRYIAEAVVDSTV